MHICVLQAGVLWEKRKKIKKALPCGKGFLMSGAHLARVLRSEERKAGIKKKDVKQSTCTT